MAGIIEKWLNNPLLRKALKFCTKKCNKCGRRIDLSLKIYTGNNEEVCIECRVASMLVREILDSVVGHLEISKDEVKKNLNDPMWRKGLSSVLEGIAHYGPKKPFTGYAPFLIVWNLTKACNLRCKHCYEVAGKPAYDELTKEEALRAVDKMGEACVAYVAISGGEPLIRPDFFSIAKRIQENEMAFSLATNGTLLSKDNVKKLKKLDCLYIQVSLDGAKPKTHNSFRGRNSFERTIKGIKNAVKFGIYVGIATTITEHNYKEVPEIIDLSERLGAGIFMHYNFIPTGRGRSIVNLDLSPEKREELLTMLISQIKQRKISLLTTAPQFSRVCSEFSYASLTHFDVFGQAKENQGSVDFLAEFVGGCGTGRLYFALEPNGDITPCVFLPIKLGNIKDDDVLDVWHNSEVLKRIRNRSEFWGFCQSCKSRNICGGCRARAYAYFNDVQGPDPGCIYNKRYWIKVQRAM